MTNFNHYDEREWLKEQLDEMSIQTACIRELLDISELCAVESWASENNLIDSEQALSDLFDQDIAPHVIKQYGADDVPAMSEAFNNWSDSLVKDSQLHPEQYQEYCYIGKYSD